MLEFVPVDKPNTSANNISHIQVMSESKYALNSYFLNYAYALCRLQCCIVHIYSKGTFLGFYGMGKMRQATGFNTEHFIRWRENFGALDYHFF